MSFIHGVRDHIEHDIDRSINDMDYELGRVLMIVKDILGTMEDLKADIQKLTAEEENDTE